MRCGAEEKSEENRKTVCIWSDAAELVLSSRIPDPRSGAGECSEEGPVLLCSNHVAMKDPVMLGIVQKRQVFYMAKEELFPQRFYWRPAAEAGRFSGQAGYGRDGCVGGGLYPFGEDAIVGVFIEGHRSKTGNCKSRKQAPRCCVTAPKRRWFRCASQRRTASCPGPSTERSFSLENLSLLNACRFLTTPACSSEGPAVPSWVKSPRCGKNP